MSLPKTMSPKMQNKQKGPEPTIMERFSPLKLENIPITSTKPKVSAFRSFRPKPGEVLDYTISETCLDMEHKGTQIAYRETKAEYVPAPEEYLRKRQMRRRVVYSHGAPPQWKFINEIWLEKQNELQKIYKEEFRKFVEKRRKYNKYRFSYKHNLTQCLVGPEWYQELSPRQIQIVDELHERIQKDIKNNTNCFTKEAIARLGLVYRPNHNKIELALKYCCGCPVEFLFILYQLLDPKRKTYSVNDRLLLSSVVHLTMTQTLRELHIRIPSPVKKKKPEKTTSPRIKKKTYESPYLEPYTFKPEPPKFEGIYRKKHIQYPESPYFSYLEFLKLELNIAEDYSEFEFRAFDDIERELIQETIEAQKLYNKMHNTTNRKLLKPHILKPCGDFEKYKQDLLTIKNHQDKKVKLPPLISVGIDQTQCTCESETQIQEESINETNYCTCNSMKSDNPPLYKFCAECSLTKKNKNINSVIAGVAVIGCQDVVPIRAGVYYEFNCDCQFQFEGELVLLESRKTFGKYKHKYLINGVVITNIGPVYSISSTLCNRRLKQLLKQSFIPNNNGQRSSLVANNRERSSIGNKNEKKTSVDNNKEEQTVNQPEKESYPADEQVNAVENCACNTENDSQVHTISSESDSQNVCHCSKEIDIFLKNKCTCEGCNVEQRRKDATFILSGVMECEHESNPKILSGVQAQQCRCLENYLEKMKRVEAYRERCRAVCELKKKGFKYAVSGVTDTEKGPVYQISSTRPPVECICKDVYDADIRLKEELQRLPKMPPTGRIQYEISGVKETSKENIYLINQALESDECQCELLYKEFMTEHSNCWEAYQQFLKSVEESRMEYLTEHRRSTGTEDVWEDKESIHEHNEGLEKTSQNSYKRISNSTSHDSGDEIKDKDNVCECFNLELKKHKSKTNKRVRRSTKNDSIVQEKEAECPCECNKSDSLKFDSNYTIILHPTCFQNEKPEKQLQLKRFIILKKIPSNIRLQMSILKKALEGLAADGYPLAKLPDAHKLPHFKLWMQLRSGVRWTQQDRRYYELFSLFTWAHTDICYQTIKVPHVELSPGESTKITWNQAEYFRNSTDNLKNNFYRKLKHQLISKTREFFPTVFAYEFPSSQYRKCYFAYSPNKEEDVVIES